MVWRIFRIFAACMSKIQREKQIVRKMIRCNKTFV